MRVLRRPRVVVRKRGRCLLGWEGNHTAFKPGVWGGYISPAMAEYWFSTRPSSVRPLRTLPDRHDAPLYMASETNSHTPQFESRWRYCWTYLSDEERTTTVRERDVRKRRYRGSERRRPWCEKDSWPGIAEIGEWKTFASLFSFHCCRFGAAFLSEITH